MSKPVKTETIVRTYDADGVLISETTSVVEVTPIAQPDTAYGLYL